MSSERTMDGKSMGGIEADEGDTNYEDNNHGDGKQLRHDIRTSDMAGSDLSPLQVGDENDDEPLACADDQSDDANPGSDGNASALLERDMRKNLLDVESSFLPDASILTAHEEPTGTDDTLVYGGSPGNVRSKSLASDFARNNVIEEQIEELDQEVEVLGERATTSPPTPPSAYKTPFHFAAETGAESDSGASAKLSSSPTAAATRRKFMNGNAGTREGTADTGARYRHKREDSQATIKEDSLSASEDSIPEPTMLSSESSSDGVIGFPYSPIESMSTNRLHHRSNFLKDHTSSQKSAASALPSRLVLSGGIDATLGADYALQSSGAASHGGMTSGTARPRFSPSRMSSMGSTDSSAYSSYGDMASSWSRTRSSTRGDGGLERLEEERTSAGSPPETPRPTTSGRDAPTDTIIAQHVQNIRVPDTIAREYREKHISPARSSNFGLSLSNRAKSNLTLKEQNSKIDKLSKENFDLKLKIHFLDQALQSRSDEGVKDMINKNVQLQTDLANEKKEGQSLRKRLRELERCLKLQAEGQASKEIGSDDEKSDGSDKQAEMEEEITYLRECLEQTHIEIERLQEESIQKEADKRRLAVYVKSMGETKSSEPMAGVEEAMEMWKDLLEAETARREHADEDAAKLREEIRRLKIDQASVTTNSHVRNVHQINKRLNVDHDTRSESRQSVAEEDVNGSMDSKATTLVEALRHENAELRRDLGAQTSMLTSRNRERERLQQEIEDLKINHRRVHGDGRSIAGDSIFERSVSRAHNHNRAESRASGHTRVTQFSDTEREEYERRHASLRDDLAKIKMTNQDLERELNAHLDILQTVEAENAALNEEKELAAEDLLGLQAERDDAVQAVQGKDEEIEELRKEAIDEIDRIAQELERREQDLEGLKQEIKIVSNKVIRLEDDLSASRRQEENLERQLEDNERELARTDQKLRDTTEKNERLEVQLESSQTEISFLREEQEGDKIKIGDLEAALNAAQSSLEDLRERIDEDRRQREVLDSQEKAEVQKVLDNLNTEVSHYKDEIRKLKKNLGNKDTESTTWKDRFETLEKNLRDVIGDLDGKRSSILKDVTKVQRDLDHTLAALDNTRQELSEKTRLLHDRGQILESAGLESRKLSELLEKERAARRADRNHFDQMQRSQQSLTRTIQQSDTRATELEQARNNDRRKYANLENQYLSQLLERNNLLLALWNRLSTLCGADFMQKNSLVGDQLPSTDVIARNLMGFSRNINLAIRTVEVLVGGFRNRIRDVEKNLWKDFQTLDHAIDVRTKRLDHLEKTVAQQTKERLEAGSPVASVDMTTTSETRERRSVSRSNSRNGQHPSRTEEISKLKNENKLLKAELKFARGASPTRSSHGSADSIAGIIPGAPGQVSRSSPPVTGIPPRESSSRASMTTTLMRHHSTSSVEALQHAHLHNQPFQTALPGLLESPNRRASHRPSSTSKDILHSTPLQPSEQRWIHRLKELERRLKAEREARLLDRSGARKRLEEGRLENEELRRELEREREGRRGSSVESLERPPVAVARDGVVDGRKFIIEDT